MMSFLLDLLSCWFFWLFYYESYLRNFSLIVFESFYFNVYYANFIYIFFFKQKTEYEMRISDWSSDVCSSDLAFRQQFHFHRGGTIEKERITRRWARHHGPHYAGQAGLPDCADIVILFNEQRRPPPTGRRASRSSYDRWRRCSPFLQPRPIGKVTRGRPMRYIALLHRRAGRRVHADTGSRLDLSQGQTERHGFPLPAIDAPQPRNARNRHHIPRRKRQLPPVTSEFQPVALLPESHDACVGEALRVRGRNDCRQIELRLLPSRARPGRLLQSRLVIPRRVIIAHGQRSGRHTGRLPGGRERHHRLAVHPSRQCLHADSARRLFRSIKHQSALNRSKAQAI